jgi:hypothetical protein
VSTGAGLKSTALRGAHVQPDVCVQYGGRLRRVVRQEDHLLARHGVDKGVDQAVQLAQDGAGVVKVEDGQALHVVGLVLGNLCVGEKGEGA